MGITVSGFLPCLLFAAILSIPYAICSWLWENS